MEGCRPMYSTGRSMKGFVYVLGDTVLRNDRQEFSIRLILECNPLVKASKKKIKKTGYQTLKI